MQQPVYPPPQSPPKKPRRRRGAFGRIARGYLMLVGACTTIYALVLLIVHVLVEVLKWIPAP